MTAKLRAEKQCNRVLPQPGAFVGTYGERSRLAVRPRSGENRLGKSKRQLMS